MNKLNNLSDILIIHFQPYRVHGITAQKTITDGFGKVLAFM